MGMGPDIDALGLSDHCAFTAQGNAFDRDAVSMRMAEALAQWVCTGELPRHTYPDPATLPALYTGIRDRVREEGIPAVSSPSPTDVHETLVNLGILPRVRGTVRRTGPHGTDGAGVRRVRPRTEDLAAGTGRERL